MKIYPINAYLQTKNLQFYTSAPIIASQKTGLQSDTVFFSGWFFKKSNKMKSVRQADGDANNSDKCSKNPCADKDEEFQNVTLDSLKGLNANGILLSLKIGDTLHRLNDETLIAVGDLDSTFFKLNIKRALTEEKTFLPNPRNIKYVYVINDENASNTFLIARMDKNHFYTHGDARNLSNDERKDSYYWCTHKIPAKYNDLIETRDKNRFRLLKTDKETNLIYYDAKFPVESFFTDGLKLENGFIIRKPSNKSEELSGTSPNGQVSALVEALKNKSKSDTKSLNIPYRTFDDIAGMDDTVELVKKKILFPLLYPEAFPGMMNRGTILYGAPGTGKTLLALAIIGEAKKRKGEDIHFIKIDSKELERSHFGESEALWRKVFKELEDNQPSLLFIDEIDSILTVRQEGNNNVPNNSVVSQFLTLLDRLEKNKVRVAIIGTTNRPDMIDSAIKRSGRLGNLIEVKKPDEKGCFDILNLYLKDKKVSEGVDRKELAKKIHILSYTGADIANLTAEASNNMYERCGIYKKMDEGIYKPEDLKGLELINEDFEKSLNS